MNQLKISDKLFIASNLASTVLFTYYGNNAAVTAGYAMLGLWVALKIVDAITGVCQRLDTIEADKDKLAASLIPEPFYASHHTYDVPSIPRLLSSIKVDDDRTLFDAIVETSTNDNLSLRLVQATDIILSSLYSINLNNGNQITDTNTGRREVERIS